MSKTVRMKRLKPYEQFFVQHPTGAKGENCPPGVSIDVPAAAVRYHECWGFVSEAETATTEPVPAGGSD